MSEKYEVKMLVTGLVFNLLGLMVIIYSNNNVNGILTGGILVLLGLIISSTKVK